MKITKSLQQRVIVGLEKGQNRVRCMESEYEDALHFGIQHPLEKNRFVTAFSSYVDTTGGFFAVFSEPFKIAAGKTWKLNRKEAK